MQSLQGTALVPCFFTKPPAMTATARMHIESHFDPATFTFSHIVWDRANGQCARRPPQRSPVSQGCTGRATSLPATAASSTACWPTATPSTSVGCRHKPCTPQCHTTVTAQKAANVHVHGGVTEAVALRTARDTTLAMPVLMLASVQINMRAGQWPPPEDNGTRYVKIPLNVI